MKKILLIVITSFGLLVGCNSATDQVETNSTVPPNATVNPDDPVSWIYYKNEKYVFDSLYDQKPANLVSTNAFTKEGDGMEYNYEIFIEENTTNLYVSDKNGEWAKFVKE